MDIEVEVLECMEYMIKRVIKKESQAIWYKKNNNKLLQRQKEYDDKNKDNKKKYDKQHNQTYNRKKINRISRWKYNGIITDDYDELYNHYLKTAYCDICRVELTYDKNNTPTTKCLDHDHLITDRPNFRNILCQSCNVKRR